MSLIQLLVVIIVFGLIYWLVMQLPLPNPFRKAAQVIMVLIAIIWLLNFVGLLPGRIRIGEAKTLDRDVFVTLESRVGVEPTYTILQTVLLPEQRDIGRS